MKYELTKETKTLCGTILYRIKALKDFSNVEEGDLGGWIEKEENLSQYGDAWVYGNARVYGDAWVYGNARVSGNAEVYGNARVYGDAEVYGDADVYGDAEVYGDAWVYGNARVSGNADVYRNAAVYGDAEVSGNADVYGNAKINEENQILTGYINKDYKDIKSKLAIQLGVYPLNNKIILFKRVNKKSKGIYTSCYDSKFEYKDNQIVKVKDYDKFNTSCGKGIHLSTPLYWDKGNTLIACEVNLKDIITIQGGKVRCKKCKVIGEVKLK